MAIDEEGYLYVVDYGNRRIEKFDPDGAFILKFGQRGGDFPGFLSPTGIAAVNGAVYVADGVRKVIHQFDYNGVYQGVLINEGLKGPESLRATRDGKLLAADANRVLFIDPVSTVVQEAGFLGDSGNRLLCAAPDGNGNILAVNFQAGEVAVMTRLDEMASGLFVQIERVDAARFPEVTVELTVQDRRGRPMVGLGEGNFLITEKSVRAGEQRLLNSGYLSANGDIALLVERSPEAQKFPADIAAAARDASSAGRLVSVVSAGETPTLERFDGRLAEAARGQDASYSPRWRFDLGLRLAATGLLNGEKRRAVVFVTTGNLGDLAFSTYGISDLAAYLANNGIVFYAVLVGSAAPSPEIEFLCAQTGGTTAQLYRSEGIKPLIEEIKTMPNGSYTLRYRSGLNTDFGRAYLPVEAEAYILERSGRDGIGYFAPLE
jgi:DNA-binding beta-propeller fold protein YncE